MSCEDIQGRAYQEMISKGEDPEGGECFTFENSRQANVDAVSKED